MSWSFFTNAAGWILFQDFSSHPSVKPDTPPVPEFIKKLSQFAQAAFQEHAHQLRAAFLGLYTDEVPKEEDLGSLRQIAGRIEALSGGIKTKKELEELELLKHCTIQARAIVYQLQLFFSHLKAYESALKDFAENLNTQTPLQEANSTLEPFLLRYVP